MPFNKSSLVGIFILSCCIPAILSASNWQWLKDAPVMSFDEQDWELLENTIIQVLANDADGDSRQWQNPETGNSGNVQVLDTRKTDLGNCRNLLISNQTKPESGVTRLNYCQQPDGQWKIDHRIQQ